MLKSQTVLSLGENIDIANAELLKDSLEDASIPGSSICLDASKIEKVDTAGLQVLFCYLNESDVFHGQAEIINASEALVKAIALCGFSNLIKLSE